MDDHEDSRELLGEFLSMSGFSIQSCASGEEALDLIAELGAPGVVVTDLSLGAMSGAELARRLHHDARTASTPIFAVTGHVEFNDAERLFDAVLVKPIALDDLSAALHRVLHAAGEITDQP